jgi:hypothetical protein
MHADETHDVRISQLHRATVEQVDNYTLDTEQYMEFLQITDEGEQEEYILMNARWIEGNIEIENLQETIEVNVEDIQ